MWYGQIELLIIMSKKYEVGFFKKRKLLSFKFDARDGSSIKKLINNLD